MLLRWLARSSRQTFGEDSYDYLQSACGLGQLLQDKGDLAGAEPLLRQAADGLALLKGPEDEESLASRGALANLLVAKGDLPAAEAQLRQLCDTARAHFGETSPTTRKCDEQHGSCLQMLGRAAGDAALYVC